jgi:hypothetical protein
MFQWLLYKARSIVLRIVAPWTSPLAATTYAELPEDENLIINKNLQVLFDVL